MLYIHIELSDNQRPNNKQVRVAEETRGYSGNHRLFLGDVNMGGRDLVYIYIPSTLFKRNNPDNALIPLGISLQTT